MRRHQKGVSTMYNYHVENLSANFNKAQTSWKEVKAQLEEVYALDISKSACKARTTRASNNVERWFKRVELLTARLPEGKKSSIVKLLTELGKELGKGPKSGRHLRVFSSLCNAISDLPIDKDQERAIMEYVRSISDCITDMQSDLKSLWQSL